MACKDQEIEASDLLSETLKLTRQIDYSLDGSYFELAEQDLKSLEAHIKTVISETFNGDFCTIQFNNIDCNSEGERVRFKGDTEASIRTTAFLFNRSYARVEESRPVATPALANYRDITDQSNARDDLLAALSEDRTLRGQIITQALRRGSEQTCSDMKALLDEFNHEDAYKRLTTVGEVQFSYPELPIKAKVVINGGAYDVERKVFTPTGQIIDPRYLIKETRDITDISLEPYWGDVSAKVKVMSCGRQSLELFLNEIAKRTESTGLDLDYLPSVINVTYRLHGIHELLQSPILIDEDAAKILVGRFTQSRVSDLRTQRPFFVAVNFRPEADGAKVFYHRRSNDVTIMAKVEHLSYYPIFHVPDRINVGFQPGQTFRKSGFPTIQPAYERVIN
jgi:hypothetical protein